MIRHFLASALLAGLLAGLAVTGLQQATTTPLILQAEQYEEAAGAHPATHAHDHGATGHAHARSDGADNGGSAPADGFERLLFTGLANVVAGVGFGFLLVGCFAISGRPASGRTGLLWGMAGFAVFTLGPSLGLAPELPAMKAAALTERQIWWMFTAAATAAGLWLLVFPKKPLAAAAGFIVIALPHLIGAPHPVELSTQIPPELSARFATASITTSAIFWACLGWLAGAIYGRGGVVVSVPKDKLSPAE